MLPEIIIIKGTHNKETLKRKIDRLNAKKHIIFLFIENLHLIFLYHIVSVKKPLIKFQYEKKIIVL